MYHINNMSISYSNIDGRLEIFIGNIFLSIISAILEKCVCQSNISNIGNITNIGFPMNNINIIGLTLFTHYAFMYIVSYNH